MKNYSQYIISKINRLKHWLLFFLLFTAMSLEINAVSDPLYPFHPSYNLPFVSSDLPIVIINLDERMAEKWEECLYP